jgi:hypothetical protein
MKLYYLGFCLWFFLLVAMLTGCTTFETKMEEMKISQEINF